MIKNLTLSFSLLFLIPLLNLQGQTLDWAIGQGGKNVSLAQDIALDKYGNVYVTGKFKDTVDFDPGPGVSNLFSSRYSNSFSVFASKFDNEGNLIWATMFDAPVGSTENKITVDDSGNVFVSGEFYDTLYYDYYDNSKFLSGPKIGANGYIIKHNSLGRVIWAKSFLGGNTFINSIETDPAGGIVFTGRFLGTIDIDPGPGTKFHTSDNSIFLYFDIIVCKLNSAGEYEWSNVYTSAQQDEGYEIVIDDKGSIYITGYYGGTIDFNPNNGGYQFLNDDVLQNSFTLKLDKHGNFKWVKNIEGDARDPNASQTITLGPSDEVYIHGTYAGSPDFDPGSGVFELNHKGHFYICKYDTSGNFIWAKGFGETISGSEPRGIETDEQGNIYLAGNFDGIVDFDPSTKTVEFTSSSWDLYILKLNQKGEFEKVMPFGGKYKDYTDGIEIDDVGNIYCSGFFSSTVDFDPGPSVFLLSNPTNVENIFVMKLSQCLLKPKFKINYNSGVLSVPNEPGETYQWLDCKSNFEAIKGANFSQYTPANKGNYAVQITKNGCPDTVGCFQGNQNILLYPNPTKGNFFITGLLNPTLIDIFNSNGQQIVKELSNKGNAEILVDLSSFPTGLYLLKIREDQKEHTLRIVKE